MIKQVADLVGPAHKVDLKGYDLMVIVEVYRVGFLFAYVLVLVGDGWRGLKWRNLQNVCGMSVVGGDFDRLKRFNLAELYDSTDRLAAAVAEKEEEKEKEKEGERSGSGLGGDGVRV